MYSFQDYNLIYFCSMWSFCQILSHSAIRYIEITLFCKFKKLSCFETLNGNPSNESEHKRS